MITKRDIGKSLAQIHSGKPARAFSASLFDDLTLLDDFNRANEDPLSKSGAWSSLMATTTMEITSNQAAQLDVATTGFSAWFTPFAADQACAITIATLPVDTDDFVFLGVRTAIGPTSGNSTGYGARFYPAAASSQFQLVTFTSGTFANLGTANGTISAGDSVGLAVIGDRLEAWHKPSAGAWTPILGVTDETFRQPGCVAFGVRDNEARLDNFYGGSL